MSKPVSQRDARYGQVDFEYGLRLSTMPPEDDGPVWMVNLMSYREQANYADGRKSDISGREADDRYAPLGPLAAVGAEVVLFADVDTQFLNDTPKWDRVAIVKYPTRRSFIDMQRLPEFKELHHHKDAGMASTFVIGCQPMAVPELPADAPSWDDVPHPPTDADPAVLVIHVIRFKEDADSIHEMATYSNRAGEVAVPHGVRIAAWMRAEGTIMGDGRTWDQVRFNAFPSKEAFMKVVLDPERLQHQANHREVAIADTYTMILRPTIDRLHESTLA